MEKSISLLDQFNLLHINDSIPQIANYAMFLTEQQEPERGISELQKLSGIIKQYHSDDCLDYAKVQETLGTIYLMTANLPQAKTHFKRAFKIYEKIWADEPEMIEAKYQEIRGVISTDWILHWKKSIRSFNKISIIYGGQLARRYIQLFVK
ncbi:MAG: tetratricopeptide repeat protein [Coprococcus comes]